MTQRVFTIAQKRPIRDGMTVSRSAQLGGKQSVTWFSLGRGTSISQECYDSVAFYLGAEGEATFLLGTPIERRKVRRGDLLVVCGGTLCGVETENGSIYTEMIAEKESVMNEKIKAGEVFQMKSLISYEEGSIANLDVVHSDKMKFVLMAFDEGMGLQPHRAPGNALVYALEGEAVIGYEGRDYPLHAGETFRFDKNGLHSVTAKGRFKMALLLVLGE